MYFYFKETSSLNKFMREPIADFLVERSIFVLVLIIPSSLFLTFRSTNCITALYVTVMQSRNVFLAVTVHNSGKLMEIVCTINHY